MYIVSLRLKSVSLRLLVGSLNLHEERALTVAFAHRTEFGDPPFMADSKKWHHIETKEFGRQTLAKIDDVCFPYSTHSRLT